MAKKIGDVFIGAIFLAFLLTGFSLFIFEADSTLDLNSGVVSTGLNEMSTNANSNTNSTTTTFTENFEAGDFSQEQTGSYVETRGADQSGLLSRGSQNVFTSFFNSLSTYLPISTLVLGLLMSLVAVVIGILALRFFWGEARV